MYVEVLASVENTNVKTVSLYRRHGTIIIAYDLPHTSQNNYMHSSAVYAKFHPKRTPMHGILRSLLLYDISFYFLSPYGSVKKRFLLRWAQLKGYEWCESFRRPLQVHQDHRQLEIRWSCLTKQINAFVFNEL